MQSDSSSSQHLAASRGYEDVVNFLIGEGVDINLTGMSPRSIRCQCMPCCLALLPSPVFSPLFDHVNIFPGRSIWEHAVAGGGEAGARAGGGPAVRQGSQAEPQERRQPPVHGGRQGRLGLHPAVPGLRRRPQLHGLRPPHPAPHRRRRGPLPHRQDARRRRRQRVRHGQVHVQVRSDANCSKAT